MFAGRMTCVENAKDANNLRGCVHFFQNLGYGIDQYVEHLIDFILDGDLD